jgi:hypothetical protein
VFKKYCFMQVEYRLSTTLIQQTKCLGYEYWSFNIFCCFSASQPVCFINCVQ